MHCYIEPLNEVERIHVLHDLREVDPAVDNFGRTRIGSPADAVDLLSTVGYVADPRIGSVVYFALSLGRPVLVEGPAGTGKTELAKALAAITGSRLVRLQCYEGLDESKALYEWDYRKQLLCIQAAEETPGSWREVSHDIFTEDFLLSRPLLDAVRADDDVLLLIDEVDRLDLETEALLLEVLSDFQVSIPELGTVVAKKPPIVVLTSNNSRELSEALKRRCLYLHVGYPDAEREAEIVAARVAGADRDLARSVAEVVESLRRLEVKKRPSVAETLDWARILIMSRSEEAAEIDIETIIEHLPILLKNKTDIDLATAQLRGVA